MKNLLALIVVFLISSFSFSQTTFRKNLGPGSPRVIRQTADGGFAITGNRGGYVMFMKTDSLGNVEFVNTYGSITGMQPDNIGNDLLVLNDGGYIIAGQWAPFSGDEEEYIIRIDAFGNESWDMKIPSPFNPFDTHYAQKIRRTSSGEYIVLGYLISINGNGYADLTLTKLDSSGNVEWLKVFDYGRNERPGDLQVTDSQYLILGNRSDCCSGIMNYFLIRTDTSGDIIDSTLFGGTLNNCYANSIYVQNDSTYYIAGGSSLPPAQNFVWHKLDTSHDTLYINNINNPIHSFICGSILRNNDNSFTVCGGEVITMGTLNNALVINIDSNGFERWRRYYIDSTYQILYNSCLTADGGMAFLGELSGIHPSSSVYLIKTDSLGYVTGIENFSFQAPGILISYFDDKITFQINNHFEFNNCIYDLNGKLILNGFSHNGEFTLNKAQELSSGIYVFRCSVLESKISISGKFLIINN